MHASILYINVFQDKVVKFANYFLSRKHVHQLRAACQLVSAIKALTENKVKFAIYFLGMFSSYKWPSSWYPSLKQ